MGRKTYEELDFTDDFLFCKILMDNEDLCIELVELITGRKINSVLHPQDQKAIQMTRDGKGIRLDVYFEDEENVIYDIEMQTINRKDLPKRTRYYHSMMDQAYLKRGSKYSELNPQYVIFICCFDLLDKGLPLYDFSMTDRYSGLILGDESYTMILNTKEVFQIWFSIDVFYQIH